MFRSITIFVTVLVLGQSSMASILPGDAPVIPSGYVVPGTPFISNGYGPSAASIFPTGYTAAGRVPSLFAPTAFGGGYTSPIVYSNALVGPTSLAQPAVRSYPASQYIPAPLTQSYAAPLIPGGLYAGGYAGAYSNSYSYTAPIARAAYPTPLGSYGAPLARFPAW